MPRPFRKLCRYGWLLAAAFALPLYAAPPAGHPTPAQASDLLVPEKPPRAADLPNEGKVLDVIHANEFSYLEIARKGSKEKQWVAIQKSEIKVGSTVRYEDGATMSNFYSKLLKRTFPSVMFVDHLAVTGKP
ncbi:hypothetical protein AB6Q56_05595 [Dechloromonas sp. ARDL1]|uniref:hypothetical protein n=1 Tax=Dechloromonas sp. ARDL1 TaxID=3322121 RepID=UPI003DA78DB1